MTGDRPRHTSDGAPSGLWAPPDRGPSAYSEELRLRKDPKGGAYAMYNGWPILRTEGSGMYGSDPVDPLYDTGKRLGV